jgi:hypothetical protein
VIRLGRIEKLLLRLHTLPTDYTWREMKVLLHALGCVEEQGNGSRCKFVFWGSTGRISLYMHAPHPSSILDSGRVEALADYVHIVLEASQDEKQNNTQRP